MPESHAKLSASGAHRWLNCTPSVRLEIETGLPDTSSPDAAKGTLAHSLAETKLRYKFGVINKAEYNRELKKIKLNELYDDEMESYIADYVKFVASLIKKQKSDDAYIGFEERLDFSPWVKDGFGTGDVVIVDGDTIEIIDLKYGVGVPVNAENNPQMKLYALGAYNCLGFLYDGLKTVKMTIYQPRINHTNSWETSVESLLKWGNEVVKPLAEKAFDGEGDPVVGSHCKFCKAKPVCRAFMEEQTRIAQYEFREPELLDNDEVADVLDTVDELVNWAKKVKDYALHKAVNDGCKFRGYKVVEGRSNRVITDSEKVQKVLTDNGFDLNDIVEIKMLGLSKLEKLVGKSKLNELCGEYIFKPDGSPTLVTEDDKREEWSSAVADFSAV